MTRIDCVAAVTATLSTARLKTAVCHLLKKQHCFLHEWTGPHVISLIDQGYRNDCNEITSHVLVQGIQLEGKTGRYLNGFGSNF